MLHNVGPLNVLCRGRLRSGLTCTSVVFGTTHRQTRHHPTAPARARAYTHTHSGTLIRAHVGSRLNRKCLSAGFPSFVESRLVSARPHQSWRAACGKHAVQAPPLVYHPLISPSKSLPLSDLEPLPLVTRGPSVRSREIPDEESQTPTWWSLEKPP